MFPLGDDNSMRRTTPYVTFVLIAINVLVFLLELQNGDAFIQEWAFVPGRFSENPGANIATIFSAMFMHGGWLHLGGNMLYLWIFGDNVEDRFGHVKFLIFYLLCGIAATFAQYYVSPGSTIPNVGASGAIAGVLGAYILMFPQARVNVLVGNQMVAMPALIVLGILDRPAAVQRRRLHRLYRRIHPRHGRCRLYGARRRLRGRLSHGLPVPRRQRRQPPAFGLGKPRPKVVTR